MLDDKGRVETAGEQRRLMEHASPWLQRLIIAALETCCRRGELTSLQWRDINLQRGQLTIRAENAKDREKRILPISPNLKAVLQLVQHDPAGKELPTSTHVFGDRIGRKVCDPKKAWAKACTAAGVVDLHFHDLRHEAASRLIEQGWPLQNVQHMLGHADAKTTSIYVNATLQSLEASMRRLGTGSQPLSLQSLHDLAHGTKSEPPPTGNDAATATANVLVN